MWTLDPKPFNFSFVSRDFGDSECQVRLRKGVMNVKYGLGLGIWV